MTPASSSAPPKPVRCLYMYQGQQCPHPPEDVRIHALNERDGLVAYLCDIHAKAYDAIKWAERERARRSPQSSDQLTA